MCFSTTHYLLISKHILYIVLYFSLLKQKSSKKCLSLSTTQKTGHGEESLRETEQKVEVWGDKRRKKEGSQRGD